MSIESSMTFESLVREKLFDGEDLVDVFQQSAMVGDESMEFVPPPGILKATKQGSSPPIQFIKTPKRPSAKEFEASSEECLFGKDLADVFEAPMGNVANRRRRSTMSRGDRRGSGSMSIGDSRRGSGVMSIGDSRRFGIHVHW